MSFDKQQIKLVREIQLLPAACSQEISNFEACDAARPRKKAARAVESVEFLPEDERGLLKQVVCVAQISQERMDVAEQLRLMLAQILREFSVVGIRVRHAFWHLSRVLSWPARGL